MSLLSSQRGKVRMGALLALRQCWSIGKEILRLRPQNDILYKLSAPVLSQKDGGFWLLTWTNLYRLVY